MAEKLHEPSLRLAYARPVAGLFVDPDGRAVDPPAPGHERRFIRVPREHGRVGVLIEDGVLVDQDRYIRAAGTAALISTENSQLEADLTESVHELAASRRRLVESANVERQRIERDLHDGIQQHIVGMRVKLELAGAALAEDPPRGRRMLDDIGREMDIALEEIRFVAQGIYPALLAGYGLDEALKSAARRSPTPVAVHAKDLGRYPLEIETAVYFACLEALQNVAKHAGPKAGATLRVWEDSPVLRFEVRDGGVGFTPGDGDDGNGLINMRDRVAAVDGALTVSSRQGEGTLVEGWVPIDRPVAGAAA